MAYRCPDAACCAGLPSLTRVSSDLLTTLGLSCLVCYRFHFPTLSDEVLEFVHEQFLVSSPTTGKNKIPITRAIREKLKASFAGFLAYESYSPAVFFSLSYHPYPSHPSRCP